MLGPTTVCPLPKRHLDWSAAVSARLTSMPNACIQTYTQHAICLVIGHNYTRCMQCDLIITSTDKQPTSYIKTTDYSPLPDVYWWSNNITFRSTAKFYLPAIDTSAQSNFLCWTKLTMLPRGKFLWHEPQTSRSSISVSFKAYNTFCYANSTFNETMQKFKLGLHKKLAMLNGNRKTGSRI